VIHRSELYFQFLFKNFSILKITYPYFRTETAAPVKGRRNRGGPSGPGAET